VNILCVEQFSKLGGGQRSLLDLLPAFLARGWQVAVGAPGPGPLVEAAAGMGCAVIDLNCGVYSQERKPPIEMARYAFESLRLKRVIEKIVDDRQIDLMYVNGPRFLPPAAWAAKRKAVPLTFHCHNRLFQKAAIALTGGSLHLAQSHVIGCCEYSVKPLRHYVTHSRIQIIYNGVRPPSSVRHHATTPLRRIGVIGRIEKEKGQLEFLAAARMIATEISQCTFVLVGAPMFGNTTYYDRVTEAAAELPVEFPGWQEDISSVLSNLDLVVVPSMAIDSLPRVIFEAFAARVPVVAFPSGGIPEIIKDGITGFLTPDSTVQSLARCIVSTMNQPAEVIGRITGRAQQAWEQDHTLEIYRHRVSQTLAKHMNLASRASEQAAALELSKKGER
jgi:glycosyltransferase involved in cell wall biosynthesis